MIRLPPYPSPYCYDNPYDYQDAIDEWHKILDELEAGDDRDPEDDVSWEAPEAAD